ncbi:hypothetical protein GIB67_029086 [Kingdonia uniflora]|uniref:Aluminum-activated malate transporter n=1 Tax=Kingdonia uniflora TaxID=39325 RepID=A0A7J7N6Q2_9MAGN|nr:hypothetical protein GIB67_029086 [Kingdonia uniflora]
MGSTMIPIQCHEDVSPPRRTFQSYFLSPFPYLAKKICNIIKDEPKKLIHSLKVGVALVLVSLLYLIDPLYNHVGENAMWAIMTVVVVFEFFAGATLSKGLNRGMGTIAGGGLGYLGAILAQEIGGNGRAISVGIFVFIFGTAATYCRLIPGIKKKYDYGTMIFILTFNLVIVSGHRSEEIIKLARERLATIVIGCLGEYLKIIGETDDKLLTSFDGYASVLHSKSRDEILANFASWEPWHGRFGFSYPWDKYLHVGELLRDLASSLFSLSRCLQSPKKPSSNAAWMSIKEPYEVVASLLACTLRELGDTIKTMKRCQTGMPIVAKLQKTALPKLNEARCATKMRTLENEEGFAISACVFLLMEMVGKVEELATEVEELVERVSFLPY